MAIEISLTYAKLTIKDNSSAAMLSIMQLMNKLSTQATNTSNNIQKIGQLTSGSAKGNFFESLVEQGKKADDAIGNAYQSIKGKILNMKGSIEKVLKGKAYNLTIGNAANLEQYETSFIALTGNSDKAKAKLKELSDYSRTTPFELPGVVNAAKALITSGLDTKQYLKDIGNLAAGTNQPIETVAEALGKIKTGNFADAFKSLNGFGIDNKMLEAKGLVFDKDGSYKGSAEKALSAVQQITKEKYGKITDIQGQTFNELTATLKNSFNAMGTDIGQKALPQVKTALSSLIVAMDKMSKSGTFDRLGNMAGAAIGKIAANIPKVLNLIDKLGTFVVKNWNTIQPILIGVGAAGGLLKFVSQIDKTIKKIEGIQKAVKELTGLARVGKIFETIFGFGPQGLILLAVIAAIAVAAVLIIKHWGPISKFFSKMWKEILTVTKNIWSAIGPTIIGAVKKISAFWNDVWPKFKQIFRAVWASIGTIIKPYIMVLYVLIQGAIGFIKGFWMHGWDIIKDTLKLAWNLMVGVIRIAWDVITGIFKLALSVLTGDWNGVWNNLKTMLVNVLNDIGILFKNIAKDALNWGKDIVLGIVDGIKGAIGYIENAVNSVASKIKAYLHFTKPDVGPLADFDTYGPDMMKLFGVGIKTNISHVIEPVKDVAVGIKTNLKNGIDTGASSLNKTNSVNTTKKENRATIMINIPKLAEQLVIRDESDIDTIVDVLANRLEKVSYNIA